MSENEGKRRGNKARRRWAPEDKIEIIRDHFSRSRMIETCEKHRVHPNMLGLWWKTVLEAGTEALSGDRRRKDRGSERLAERYEAELAQKNAVIAELSSRVLGLKKSLGEI